MILTSYHNHTTWSDGAASTAIMVQAAIDAGLGEVGISDHYVLAPGGRHISWSMDTDRLAEYVAEIERASTTAEGIGVKIGIEADFFPETVESLRNRLRDYPFDYVIGSVHILDGFHVDETSGEWSTLNGDERNEKWRSYWKQIRLMAESGAFDIAAHLDLPKKFGYRPTVDVGELEDAALQAIASANMAIEINTAGWNLPAKEAYPSLDILRKARLLGIKLLINADAHLPIHITRNFDKAMELVKNAGYTELTRYQGRTAISNPI